MCRQNINEPKLIRFDWAMKRLLRNKANFCVLEGFLTSLLGDEIRIEKLLESEGNADRSNGKYNRVDILAEDSSHRKLLIEVQNQSEDAYFHRMLFGTSKIINDYIDRGQNYDNISKIYSINLVYFPMPMCKDYVYRGSTRFLGLHDGQELEMSVRWKEKFHAETVADIYPEYFLLLAHDFDKWSKTPLDQWMYFLSQGVVHEGSDAPGLSEARKKMQIDSLSKEEREDYFRHLDDLNSMSNIVENAREDGLWKGRREGLKEGREEGLKEGVEKGREEGRREERIKLAAGMIDAGIDISVICSLTGLTPDEVNQSCREL